jgi:hypothetical protein
MTLFSVRVLTGRSQAAFYPAFDRLRLESGRRHGDARDEQEQSDGNPPGIDDTCR